MTKLEELVSSFYRNKHIFFEDCAKRIFIDEHFQVLKSMKNINGYLTTCGLDTICSHIFYLRNRSESII